MGVVEGNVNRLDLLAVSEDRDPHDEVGALGDIGLTGSECDLLELVGQTQLDLALVLPVEVGADPHDVGSRGDVVALFLPVARR